MSVIDNSNLGTLWNRILGLFTARKINNKSLAKDITINDEDIPSTAVSGETTVEGALGNIADQLSDQSRQIDVLKEMTAYVETGTTALRAYTIGQFFIIDDTLYKVIKPIASGASFTDSNRVAVTNGGLNSTYERTSITLTSANITINRNNSFIQDGIASLDFNLDINTNISLYEEIFTMNISAANIVIMNIFNGHNYNYINVPVYVDGNKLRAGGSLARGTRITGTCMFFIKTN